MIRLQLRTYLLTPCSRVLPEKLTSSQLVKKFPAFYGTRRFIAAITTARHPSQSWARSIQSMPPSHCMKIHLNTRIILPSMRGSSKSFLRFPHQNPVCVSPLLHMFYMPHPSHSSRFNHPNNFGWRVQIIKLIIRYFSPFPCYLGPLRPKYSPQHPILKHPQPTFLPEAQRPCFTLLQNNRQNYNFCIISPSLYFWIAN